MMKCYITGIELNKETAYVLNVSQTKQVMRELKNKYDGMGKMIFELGICDKVEIVDKNGKKVKQRRMRLLCKQLADAYSETYSEKNIFVSWKDWLTRKNNDHYGKNKS